MIGPLLAEAVSHVFHVVSHQTDEGGGHVRRGYLCKTGKLLIGLILKM